MIYLILNRRDFEYDVYSLIKAFYTKSEIRVFDAWEEMPSPTQDAAQDPLHDPAQSPADIPGMIFDVRFDEGIGAGKEAKAQEASEEQDMEKAQEACGVRIPADAQGYVTLRIHERRPGTACGDAQQYVLTRESRCLITSAMPRMQVKSEVKTLLYDALCAMTGRTLPWGDLTGIRPVKLAMGKIREGKTNAQTAAFLRETYHVSPAKSALAVMIANKEKHLLDAMDYRNGWSLYVGIPFCPSICLYCSFSSSPLSLWKNRVDEYLDALENEMRGAREMFAPKRLQTVYVGGGTPTTLESGQLDRLLRMVRKYFDLSEVAEFTVEAGRPDSITRDKLKVLADHGIGRISINPQTMNQKTLDLIGRRHSVAQFEEAFAMARDLGFSNINTDLIVGLPGEGPQEVAYTMERIAKLSPESVTVHALALKRSSRLNEKLKDYEEISFQASDEIMDLTMRVNEANGLYPYYLYRQKNMAGNFENVGYAAPGKECLYNILIMEEVQSILALGAGGSTKLVYDDGRIERIENVKDIKSYIERSDEMIERKLSGAVKYRYSGR